MPPKHRRQGGKKKQTLIAGRSEGVSGQEATTSSGSETSDPPPSLSGRLSPLVGPPPGAATRFVMDLSHISEETSMHIRQARSAFTPIDVVGPTGACEPPSTIVNPVPLFASTGPDSSRESGTLAPGDPAPRQGSRVIPPPDAQVGVSGTRSAPRGITPNSVVMSVASPGGASCSNSCPVQSTHHDTVRPTQDMVASLDTLSAYLQDVSAENVRRAREVQELYTHVDQENTHLQNLPQVRDAMTSELRHLQTQGPTADRRGIVLQEMREHLQKLRTLTQRKAEEEKTRDDLVRHQKAEEQAAHAQQMERAGLEEELRQTTKTLEKYRQENDEAAMLETQIKALEARLSAPPGGLSTEPKQAAEEAERARKQRQKEYMEKAKKAESKKVAEWEKSQAQLRKAQREEEEERRQRQRQQRQGDEEARTRMPPTTQPTKEQVAQWTELQKDFEAAELQEALHSQKLPVTALPAQHDQGAPPEVHPKESHQEASQVLASNTCTSYPEPRDPHRLDSRAFSYY